MYLKNLNKSIVVRISSEDYELLNKVASENDMSISYLIRSFIKLYLGGDLNGNFKTN